MIVESNSDLYAVDEVMRQRDMSGEIGKRLGDLLVEVQQERRRVPIGFPDDGRGEFLSIATGNSLHDHVGINGVNSIDVDLASAPYWVIGSKGLVAPVHVRDDIYKIFPDKEILGKLLKEREAQVLKDCAKGMALKAPHAVEYYGGIRSDVSEEVDKGLRKMLSEAGERGRMPLDLLKDGRGESLFLATRESLLGHEGRSGVGDSLGVDFASAPYWVVGSKGLTVEPVYERNDLYKLFPDKEVLGKFLAEREAREQSDMLSKAFAADRLDRVILSNAERRQSFSEVQAQFAPVGQKNEFGIDYARKDNGEIAFHDSGKKLYTNKNDVEIAIAMTKMAEAKGWESIKVSGKPEFKREVWLEASLKRVEVKGFSPSEKDLAALAVRREQVLKNAVEHSEKSAPVADKSASEKPEKAKTDAAVSRAAASLASALVNPKVFEGVLIEHGRAPYQHDKNNQSSYYVRLRDDAGKERTAWGVDLKRAMDKSGATVGDKVRLENEGYKTVSVEVAIRDKNGKVTGHQEKDARRAAWNVEKTQGQNITAALARAVVMKAGIDPESPKGKQFLQAVDNEAVKREAAGKLPKVPVRDAKAEVRKREADKTKPRPHRGAVRKEKDIHQEQAR
jgi:hypothetical protein